MSKRRHYGSSGDTPGKTAPQKSEVFDKPGRESEPNEKPARRVYFLTRAVTVQSDAQLLLGQGKKQQHWWSMWLCIGKEPTATDWPNHKDEKFWEACTKAIADATDLPKRTGRVKSFTFFQCEPWFCNFIYF